MVFVFDRLGDESVAAILAADFAAEDFGRHLELFGAFWTDDRYFVGHGSLSGNQRGFVSPLARGTI